MDTLKNITQPEILSHEELLATRAHGKARAKTLNQELGGLTTPQTAGIIDEIQADHESTSDSNIERINNGRQLSEVDEELNRRYGEELSSYARDEAEAVLNKINTQVFMQSKYIRGVQGADADSMLVSRAVEMLERFAADEEIKPYAVSEAVLDAIDEQRDTLDRLGLLTIVDEPDSEPRLTHDRRELERAQELNRFYRTYHNELGVDAALGKKQLPMHEWAVYLEYDEYEALQHHMRSIDVDQEIARITIEGIDKLPFTHALSEAFLRRFLRKIPAIALQGVNCLRFDDESTQEDLKSDLFDGKGSVNGYHAHSLTRNSAEVVIHIAQMRAPSVLSVAVYGEEGANRRAKSELLDIIIHEFGHALHTTLPVSLLDRWDEAARAENVDVTPYVSEMRRSGNIHELEDFADSFMLYVRGNNLDALAPGRYYAMQEIFDVTQPPAVA